MRVFWIITLIVAVALTATLSMFWPALLAKNKFLVEFVSHEIMAFLVVIMTITFASVANIHLTVSRAQAAIADLAKRKELEKEFAGPLRAETRSSAWLLFWGLVICGLALIVKGQFPEVEQVVSFVHGVAIIVLITYGVVTYDIYEAVFELVGLEASDAGKN